MKKSEKDNFTVKWHKYFPGCELPITFHYTDEEGLDDLVKPGSVHRCIISAIQDARKGKNMRFAADAIGCFGGKRYAGFTQKIMPNFDYFLSCGIEGKLEGERYKKSPELVRLAMQNQQPFKAPGRYIAFKRWDRLDEADNPQVVIFFAGADVLAGLFTLANFDQEDHHGVIAPFGSGCSAIIYHPYFQGESHRPKAVVGMFDISARPFVRENELTFSAPMSKLQTMAENMEESFLITKSWQSVRQRLAR